MLAAGTVLLVGGGAVAALAFYVKGNKATPTDASDVVVPVEPVPPVTPPGPSSSPPPFTGPSPLSAPPGTANVGTLALEIKPSGGARVSIISSLGGKQEWDGAGPLTLSDLPAGNYRTKVQPKERNNSFLASVKVVAGQTCSYTLDTSTRTEEWTEGGCR